MLLATGAIGAGLAACESKNIAPITTDSKNKNNNIASFPAPVIMNWTILPITFAAKCWIDDTYKLGFLANPTQHFIARESLFNMPSGATFSAHENTSKVRHLPLPFKNANVASLPRPAVSSILANEVDDTSLEWSLPADVIEEAFFNASFKAQLLSNPASALSSMGYSTGGVTINVHENSVSHYHLALVARPSSVNSSTSYANALAAATSNMDLASSKCCATGTCDTDRQTQPPVYTV